MADSFEEARRLRKKKGPKDPRNAWGNDGGGKSEGECPMCGSEYENGLGKHLRNSCTETVGKSGENE